MRKGKTRSIFGTYLFRRGNILFDKIIDSWPPPFFLSWISVALLNRSRAYLVLSDMVLPCALWLSSTIHTNLTCVGSHGPHLRVGGGEAAQGARGEGDGAAEAGEGFLVPLPQCQVFADLGPQG
jgi:hypothetical protein